MNLADCYRALGLRSGASLDDIKASYRRLARQYHPDVNPGNQQTREKFIALTEAYKYLIERVKPVDPVEEIASSQQPPTTERSPEPKIKITRKPPKIQISPELSKLDQQLKQTTYEQLQQLLKEQRYPRAVAVIEALAQRLPKDPEVRQWQAIAYKRWASDLINRGDLNKARAYLKKALRTDPRNRTLWAEVEKDFRRIEQMF